MMQGISWNDKELEVNAFCLMEWTQYASPWQQGKNIVSGWNGRVAVELLSRLLCLFLFIYLFSSSNFSFLSFFLFPTRMQNFMYSVVKNTEGLATNSAFCVHLNS